MNNSTVIVDEILNSGHPVVVHFPLMGVMLGAMAAITAFLIAIAIDLFKNQSWMTIERELVLERFIDRFEFASWILIFLGELSLIAAAITGIASAGGAEASINNELLEFKIRLSIYTFFLLLAPLAMKVYFAVLVKGDIFAHTKKMSHDGLPEHSHSRIPPILYIIPIIIAAYYIVLIGGAGGRFTYGHSILDTFGLGFLLPGDSPA